MTSTVLPSPRRQSSARHAVIAAVTVMSVLGAGWCGAEVADLAADTESAVAAPAAPANVGRNPFADRFPNLVLQTHEGKNVWFYDDLIRDKIVLINFMYATCTKR